MLYTERLYEKLKEFQKLTREKKLGEALVTAFAEQTLSNAVNSLIVYIDDARLEVESCNFSRTDKQLRYLQELSDLRGRTLERLVVREQGSAGPFYDDAAIERIGAIADATSERIDVEPTPMDRGAFIKVTQELIQEVNTWDTRKYEVRSILLTLGLIAELASSSAVSVSDAEIRRRISRLVAGFAVDYSAMDKEFETKWEKIKRWARLGYKGASIPLGLTADASAVVGLLPKP
ncbi:hypothetical protein KBY28_15690 [Ruegeria pomeroyi]|uniref:hypothetical protein n=1 Tax=Ruegeria pomeroyi TaxID=89184 RepID=UPI001F3DF250|nr:hypothetical protein [Ruegeria pomeroyi]MCE8509893.1 hypothetical protein [Ruegeria pomeroyi]